MFSFTFNYIYALYICTLLIKHIQYTNVSQAGGVEAEYPNSFGYNPSPSPASMTYVSYQQGFLGAHFGGGGGASTPKFCYSPSRKRSAGI